MLRVKDRVKVTAQGQSTNGMKATIIEPPGEKQTYLVRLSDGRTARFLPSQLELVQSYIPTVYVYPWTAEGFGEAVVEVAREGNIVIQDHQVLLHPHDHQSEVAVELAELAGDIHLRCIEMADRVVIVGRPEPQTLAYARQQGKPVSYWKNTSNGEQK